MVTIKAESVHINVSPTMFHLYAMHYYRCRKGFQLREPFSPVPYFLVCRAIELELKARHLKSKSRTEVKKEYGHNIKRAYDDLDALEQILDEIEYSQLEKASAIYNVPNKGFEYCSVYDAATGYTNFPDLHILDRIANKLIGDDT